MQKLLTFVSASLALTLPAFAAPGKQEIVRFEGPGLSIQGPGQVTEWGRPTFKEGVIELDGKKFQIFVNSRYGKIGALAVDNSSEKSVVLYFDSSFRDSETAVGNPVEAAAQSFEGCNESYNSYVVVYDVTGVDIKDENGNVLNLKDRKVFRTQMLPNLTRTLENSKSAKGYCRMIEQVPAK